VTRILLTGSSGWLGRFLVPRLRAAGHVVIGLDVAPGANTQIVGSASNSSIVERAFSVHGIEAVVHAGALHKPDMMYASAQDFLDVNVTGTLNLLNTAVRANHDRFVFTSTTSLMISDTIHREQGTSAIWVDEELGPLAPRNIYGVTKLAAEGLCRMHYLEHGLNCVVLRTGRFFREEDDTSRELAGPNLKANEFLNRRLTVEDAAEAHLAAFNHASTIGFGTFIICAPTPFSRSDANDLKRDAASVVTRYFPDVQKLYAQRGWRLPATIGRVYDGSRAERALGFRCATDFGRVLDALRTGGDLPFAYNPATISQTARPDAECL